MQRIYFAPIVCTFRAYFSLLLARSSYFAFFAYFAFGKHTWPSVISFGCDVAGTALGAC